MADQGLVDAIVVAYRLDQAVAATVVRRLQAADLDIELLSLDSAPEPQSPPVVPGARAFVVIFGASAGLETDPFSWLLAEEFLSQRAAGRAARP